MLTVKRLGREHIEPLASATEDDVPPESLGLPPSAVALPAPSPSPLASGLVLVPPVQATRRRTATDELSDRETVIARGYDRVRPVSIRGFP
jgi:hypothetical protein